MWNHSVTTLTFAPFLEDDVITREVHSWAGVPTMVFLLPNLDMPVPEPYVMILETRNESDSDHVADQCVNCKRWVAQSVFDPNDSPGDCVCPECAYMMHPLPEHFFFLDQESYTAEVDFPTVADLFWYHLWWPTYDEFGSCPCENCGTEIAGSVGYVDTDHEHALCIPCCATGGTGSMWISPLYAEIRIPQWVSS